MAKQLQGHEEFRIAKVDCTTNARTCGLFGVRGYPTLLLVDGDKYWKFAKGDRNKVDTHRDFLRSYADLPAEGANPLAAAPALPTDPIPAPGAARDLAVPLNSRNVADQLASGRWLVFATAKWCGHCKALEPTIQALATSRVARVNIGRIDCEDDAALCSHIGVKAFPHIILAHRGHAVVYSDADRSEQALRHFAATANAVDAAPLSLPRALRHVERWGAAYVLDAETFDTVTATGAWMVAFVHSNKCDARCTALMEDALPSLSKARSGLGVGVVECNATPALCAQLNVTATPSVLLFFRERGFRFTGPALDASSLGKFADSGFKDAPQLTRVHVAVKRRLSWATALDALAWQDFLRQYRHLLLACVLLAFTLWGVLMGGLCAGRDPRPQYYTQEPSTQGKAASKKSKSE